MRTGSTLKRRTAIGAAILTTLTLTTTASTTPTQSMVPALKHSLRTISEAASFRPFIERPQTGANPTSDPQAEDDEYAAPRRMLMQFADRSNPKADETRLVEAERVYISMMFDTIDTAYMATPSLRGAADNLRKERFLLASPPFAPPDTIASVLAGKSPYYRHAIDQFHADPSYFDFLAACLCIAYANARDEYLAIEAPSVEEMGIWPIPAPRGYMPSVDPQDIVEEDLREEYAERYDAFMRMQELRSHKQRAESRLKRTTRSFQTIAERIQSAADDQVIERFLEILREHAGEAAIHELLPEKVEGEE